MRIVTLPCAFFALATIYASAGCDSDPATTATSEPVIVNGVTANTPADVPPPQTVERDATPFPTEGNPAAKPGVEGEPALPEGDLVPLPTEGNPQAKPGVEGTPESFSDDDQAMTEEIRAALATLNAEDRALAEKQKICPVGDAPLGSMGAPVKVTVAGHDVFLCCEHCEEPLKAEPEKYLAKIGLKPNEEAAEQ